MYTYIHTTYILHIYDIHIAYIPHTHTTCSTLHNFMIYVHTYAYIYIYLRVYTHVRHVGRYTYIHTYIITHIERLRPCWVSPRFSEILGAGSSDEAAALQDSERCFEAQEHRGGEQSSTRVLPKP